MGISNINKHLPERAENLHAEKRTRTALSAGTAFMIMLACFVCTGCTADLDRLMIDKSNDPLHSINTYKANHKNDSSRKEIQVEIDEPAISEWTFSPTEDLQLPELPTGCEATAGAAMLRMNGIQITKTQVADAMPRSSTDFVHAFIGDPYTEQGWACSAPCLKATLNSLIDTRKFKAKDLTGTSLDELPTPCCVWFTSDLQPPHNAVFTAGKYGIYRQSHCIVLLSVGDETVEYLDPLKGIATADRKLFKKIYNGMGKQAVYLKKL